MSRATQRGNSKLFEQTEDLLESRRHLHFSMRGQVFCRVGARTRATDLLSPDDTVGELRTRILGDAVTQLPGADDVVRARFVSPEFRL